MTTIRSMFDKDINRKIHAVVQVEQDEQEEILAQELGEYVVTQELAEHSAHFFERLQRAETHDVGIWISGFYGSGKSHFLKMLSYLLSGRMVKGRTALEWFRSKFDAATVEAAESAGVGHVQTVLFNIGRQDTGVDERVAVLDCMRRRFYGHIGVSDSDLKAAQFEMQLVKLGRFDAFRDAVARACKKTWEEVRASFRLKRTQTKLRQILIKALEMEADAADSVLLPMEVGYSVDAFAYEVEAWLKTQPEGVRIAFMIDEIGQFVGSSVSMLLNLQSIVEALGAVCSGRAWVVCTAQVSVDVLAGGLSEVSRILARFGLQMTLTSSSADEVIQKRLLKKTPQADAALKAVYETHKPVLENLLTFRGCGQQMASIRSAETFAQVFPCLPYQFDLVQDIYAGIRQNGAVNASNGERSLLAGFQMAVQQVQDGDSKSLVALWRYYDAIGNHAEQGVRSAIEHCTAEISNENSALYGHEEDLQLLKLLAMLRCAPYLPASLENVSVLMADRIEVDVHSLKQSVHASLERLCARYYIEKREGGTWAFLTEDERQIVSRIRNTIVEDASICEKIGSIIQKIVEQLKYVHSNGTAFGYDLFVDDMPFAMHNNDLRIRFLTPACAEANKQTIDLLNRSLDGEVIVKLCGSDDAGYYNTIDYCLKVEKLVKEMVNAGTTVNDRVRQTIEEYRQRATELMTNIEVSIEDAICKSDFFAAGEGFKSSGSAKKRIHDALARAVDKLYSKLNLIMNRANEGRIQSILNDKSEFECTEAALAVESYVKLYLSVHQSEPMLSEIIRTFGTKPYAWQALDTAAQLAVLIRNNKIMLSGCTSSVEDCLTKRSLQRDVIVKLRSEVPLRIIREVCSLSRDFWDVQEVPKDETQLFEFWCNRLNSLSAHLVSLHESYECNWPGNGTILAYKGIVETLLNKANSPLDLFQELLSSQDELFEAHDEFEEVEEFYQGAQRVHFVEALHYIKSIENDLYIIEEDAVVSGSLLALKRILKTDVSPYNFGQIKQIPLLLDKIKSFYNIKLEALRRDVIKCIDEQLEVIQTELNNESKAQLLNEALGLAKQWKERIERNSSYSSMLGQRIEAEVRLKARLA